MNEEMIKGKWTEMKGEILSQWGKMTNDELDKTSGNAVSILGLIQQKYGAGKEEVEEKLKGIMERFSQKTENFKQNLKKDDKTLH